MTTEIRLLEADLENKLEIATFSGDNLRMCCQCGAGLTAENKPIYFSEFQKGQLKEVPKTHGYCIPCLNITYEKAFGMPYQRT